MKKLLVSLCLVAILTECHMEIPSVPKADFTITGGNCNVPCQVTFTSASENVNNYLWSFGDGATSADQSPVHTYSTGGLFNVSLIVQGDGGKAGITKQVTIQSPTFATKPRYSDFSFASMVLVKGGTFQMGDTRNEGYPEEKPVHNVTLSDFYIGQYEVTQRQWYALMGSNPSNFPGCDDCPVEHITWDEAQAFLGKLNQNRPSGAPAFRLPTEAEWEYAAGGGAIASRTRFGNGKDIANPAEINYNGSDFQGRPSYSVVGVNRGKTVQVGSFAPNSLGLYDMSGNAAEWCGDWFGAYSSSAQTNPTGPSSGTNRLIRGSSWSDMYAQDLRVVGNRINGLPSYRYLDIGLRVVAPKQ